MSTTMLPVPTRDTDTLKSDLEEFGFCYVKDALTPDQIERMTERLEEQAQAEEEQDLAYLDGGSTQNWGDFRDEKGDIRKEAFATGGGGKNQRVWMLINKGKVFHELLEVQIVRDLIGHKLGDDYLLSSYSANIAREGGVQMLLHTDQWWMPAPTRADREHLPIGSMSRTRFDEEEDAPMIAPLAAVNTLWMLNGFSEENGGTRVVPGSHKHGVNPPRDRKHETVAATGPPGTALILDARTWHGTGANVRGDPRLALLVTFCGPQFRPQVNYTIGTDPKVLEDASEDLLALLGFKVWNAYGRTESPTIDFVYPIQTPRGEMKPRG